MADNNLDSFFAELSDNEPEKETSSKPQETSKASLEDEFARLLNNFISGEDAPSSPEPKAQSNASSELDGFITEEKQNQNLDNFITADSSKDISSSLGEVKVDVLPEKSEEEIMLKTEEYELSRAIYNFQDGINAIADKKNLKTPRFSTRCFHYFYINIWLLLRKKLQLQIAERCNLLCSFHPKSDRIRSRPRLRFARKDYHHRDYSLRIP